MGGKLEKSWAIALVPLSVLLSLLVPLPSFLLDIGLCLNFIFTLTVVFWTFSIKSFRAAKAFPFLFLYLCLFRLGLNLASTRNILSVGWASSMIQSLGEFLSLDSLFIGFTSCFCIFLVNFIVIAKGAERVAEVRARFVLEALPGKQLSLDADLGAERESFAASKKQKIDLAEESDFFSSMEGVFRFVKGDAIISCVLLLLNMGVAVKALFVSNQSIHSLWCTVIGDAFVSQMPALIVSCSAATLIAKVGNEETLADHMMTYYKQARSYFGVIAGIMSCILLLPGSPKALVGTFIVFLLWGYQKPHKSKHSFYINIDVPSYCITLPNQGPTACAVYAEACNALRKELGIEFERPLLTHEGEKTVLLLGEHVFSIQEFNTREVLGVLREVASESITTKHIRSLINLVQEQQKLSMDEIIPRKISENSLMFLMRLLIKERVPLFYFPKVLEAIATYDHKHSNKERLLQHVRKYLGKLIGQSLLENAGKEELRVITVDSHVEQMICDAYAKKNPHVGTNIVNQIKALLADDPESALRAIVTGYEVRYEMKQMVASHFPDLLVLAHNELPENAPIKVVGGISDDVLVV